MTDAASPQPPIQESPLAAEHESLGAKFAPFAGWRMPIQYEGIMPEHRAVREACGAFDISHMGQFVVEGPGAGEALNRLLTNDVAALERGQGQYTLLLEPSGGVIDDLILYRQEEESYFLVVNAARIAEDQAWITPRLPESATLVDDSPRFGGLAIQGPQAEATWQAMRGNVSLELPERNGIATGPGGLILCRTGYTGEDGFELFAPTDGIAAWFRAAIEAGATPCGLGARDTLRLEKGYPLNGSDLDGDHTPLEAGLGFFCKLDKPEGFTGIEVLVRQKEEGLPSRLAAIRQVAKGPPPRHGYEIYSPGGEQQVATLTSGSLSPSLREGIALAYLPPELARPGTPLEIGVRGRRFAAEVVRKPFL